MTTISCFGFPFPLSAFSFPLSVSSCPDSNLENTKFFLWTSFFYQLLSHKYRGYSPIIGQDKVLRARHCSSFVFNLVLMRLVQSSSRIEKNNTCLASLGPSVVRVRGSKVKYATWSSHDLKVLDGKDKLVVESNPTIFKSHLIHSCNTKICVFMPIC